MPTPAGRIVHRGSGAVVAETEYGLTEATKGLTKLDLREQELKDMEVARKLQEEEMKVRKHGREVLDFVNLCMQKVSSFMCSKQDNMLKMFYGTYVLYI